MKKKVLAFLIITILSVSFFAIKETKAGPEHNVWGWAWAGDTIGWVSFNCYNDYGSGMEGHCIADGYASDYGVHICISDTDSFCNGVLAPKQGKLVGYAWAGSAPPGFGYISFADYDGDGDVDVDDRNGSPLCAPNCEAEVDLGSCSGGVCPVSGWARALSLDSWIKLRGTWINPVFLNIIPDPDREFEGWAWGGGDSVLGWLSFNYKNCDTDSNGFVDVVCGGDNATTAVVDYKVMTSVPPFPGPPYVEPGSTNIQYEEYCDLSPSGRIGFEWTYQDNEGDQQAQYNLQIATDAGFNSLVVDAIVNQSISPGSNGSTAVSVVESPTVQTDDLDIGYTGPGTTYYWRVKVKDTTGIWSINWELGPSFSTPSNPYPNPSFTFYPSNPPAEVEVTFTDESFCYTGVDDCKDDANTSYAWDFGDGSPIDTTKGDTVYTYPIFGLYTVQLGITDVIDGVGRTCYQEEDLTATLPLPTWKEIAPF